MSNINELFSALQLELISAQKEFDKLNKPATTLEELNVYNTKLRDILQDLKKVTTKVKADRSPNKQVWLRRIDSISDDYRTLSNQFKKLQNTKIINEKRSELLNKQKEEEEVDLEAAMLKENDSITRSTAMADYYLEMGSNSLNNLYDQGTVLKRAQRRVLDIANSLGLTGTVIQKAMSRSWWDRCMVYTGIIVISICLIGIWYYKHHYPCLFHII